MHIRFTGFNRPEYFRTVIDSWNRVRGIEKTQAILHLEPSEHVSVMRDIFFDINTHWATCDVNSERLGVLVNPWAALDEGFSVDDFVILAEDDVVVSDDVLEYFDGVRHLMDEKTLAVCAFSKDGGNPFTVQRSARFSPLVWGTTRYMWTTYLRETWDKDYSTGNPDGSCAGWDHNINRILKNENMHVISPLASRSDHIGELGGIHMVPELFESSKGRDFRSSREEGEFILE